MRHICEKVFSHYQLGSDFVSPLSARQLFNLSFYKCLSPLQVYICLNLTTYNVIYSDVYKASLTAHLHTRRHLYRRVDLGGAEPCITVSRAVHVVVYITVSLVSDHALAGLCA